MKCIRYFLYRFIIITQAHCSNLVVPGTQTGAVSGFSGWASCSRQKRVIISATKSALLLPLSGLSSESAGDGEDGDG